MKVWFLQHIHVLTLLFAMNTERVMQSKLPESPFVWCTKVYSIHVPLLTWVPRLVFLYFIEQILCASAGCHLPGFLTSTGQAGWRKSWEIQWQSLVFIILSLTPCLPKGADTHLEQPSCILSFLDCIFTTTDLFPAYTDISAQLQGKKLNFNEIPTKPLTVVGIILYFLCAHTLIPSGKRFYLSQMKADRQPSNQSTSQKMPDYSRKQHLTA